MVRVRPGFAGEVATDLSYLARNVKEPLKTSQKTPRNSGLGWFRIYSFGVFLLGTVSRSHSINFYLILDLTIGLYFDIAMEPWRFAQCHSRSRPWWAGPLASPGCFCWIDLALSWACAGEA